MVKVSSLNEVVTILTGEFDNQEQFDAMSADEQAKFPFARHKNHVINDKINHLPSDNSVFYILEESYYTVAGRDRFKSDIYVVSVNSNGKVQLTSSVIPKESTNCKYEEFTTIDYDDIAISDKFVPIEYTEKDHVYSGHSESMFTPTTKFVLDQKLSKDELIILEEMYRDGKRIFGFDAPICYKRI